MRTITPAELRAYKKVAARLRMRKLRAERARAKLKAEVVAELKAKLAARIDSIDIPTIDATMALTTAIADALDEVAQQSRRDRP